jgi:hypothetical protein
LGRAGELPAEAPPHRPVTGHRGEEAVYWVRWADEYPYKSAAHAAERDGFTRQDVAWLLENNPVVKAAVEAAWSV